MQTNKVSFREFGLLNESITELFLTEKDFTTNEDLTLRLSFEEFKRELERGTELECEFIRQNVEFTLNFHNSYSDKGTTTHKVTVTINKKAYKKHPISRYCIEYHSLEDLYENFQLYVYKFPDLVPKLDLIFM